MHTDWVQPQESVRTDLTSDWEVEKKRQKSEGGDEGSS